MFMKKYKRIPHVGSVMSPFPYFVDTDDEVTEVARLMDEHHIGHIPVQQEGRVVGIVSQRDLYHLGDRLLPDTDKARIRVREIMVDNPYVVAFETPLNKVALEMAKRRIGSAIVLHHGKLAGILSATDICRILAEILESEFSPSSGNDAA
jgi:acetoin utilization protein AcuB